MNEQDSGVPEPSPEPEESHRTDDVPIVGIGASAGGIDALRRLLQNVHPGCGMALVVVQHLDPSHVSALAEILSRGADLPVAQIENDTEIEADHVYVIPPNASLSIANGRLSLAPLTGTRAHPNVIDEFFTSLAHDRGERAACVILSGTGSDGTLGLRAVKENGGLTVAQADAEYDGMMRSAVATGLVDFMLRPEEIPASLIAYFREATRVHEGDEEEAIRPETPRQLEQITTLLRAQTGHDFSNYKERTIIRRVRRRMHVLQVDDVDAFIERLRRDAREVSLLFQDLLIGVTSFFRDPDAFEALRRDVIPRLFEGKGPDDTIRVWVAGCATGEEAYSIAMLLRESAPALGAPKLQIFASDIDDHALDTARTGRYPATVAKDVSPERLMRFFHREDGTYRIASDLREICLFSSHNLLRDAPFSKLDLISCRNLLIYLSAELQDRIIPLFHYALNQNGYLFLGTSENVTRHTRLFLTMDKVQRIFRRRSFPERRIPEFPLTAPDLSRRAIPALALRPTTGETSLRAAADRQLMERFAPAYAVINSEGDLLHSSGRTGKYLELPAGVPDTNIFNLARPGLRVELRAALHKAMVSGQLVVQSKIRVGTNGSTQDIDLYIQPMRYLPASEGLFMVVFQDLGDLKPLGDQVSLVPADSEDAGAHVLEEELRATKERLQTTTEELEASNEELKSGNEELQSMNEELQSANEELQTSKEELQSINEELQTVNAELNARVEELSHANNDMRNLLDSTQIATVFLDRMLHVKSFTPAAKDVFRLVESDAGRPIMHVRARFESETLQEDAERVLRTLGTIEKPVSSNENGTRYMMRMLPYRTADNVIDGVVLTFTDVTRISAAEAEIARLTEDLRARIAELETLLEIVPVGVMIADKSDGSGVVINRYGAHLVGQPDAGKGLLPLTVPFRLLDGDWQLTPDEYPLRRAARSGEAVPAWQGRLEIGAGRSVFVMMSATPLLTDDRRVRGAIAAIVDMTEHKRAEEQQLLLLHELQHRVKNILATVSSLATRMAQRSRTVDEFQAAFLSRIRAMGRMHDLLANGAWSGASLRDLISAALEPYVSAARPNVRLVGSDIRLDANAAATMGMVLHELATNAAKYGALSTPGGTVEVAWAREQEAQAGGSLELTWIERDGPPVDPAGTPGFGTSFITRSVEYELQGTVSLELAPPGLRCTIRFPLSGNVERPWK
ncbi:MAG TPA: CheR family methyltransferase [Acetobacteraceae bacterium]|jgi:two-component system, chemotaxis family, CheB/CheR fusion protein|nr:CheR family methyltransferase [Acetobacteraceae bacterium]